MSEEKPEETKEFAEFWETLHNHPEKLSASQKALLNSSVRLAWAATATDNQLSAGFDESFTPEQAELLRNYHAGPEDRVQLLPRFFKGFIKL
jgi:hypothetical protein